jgi:hypothetical protein
MRGQLHLGKEKTLNKILRQTLTLEVIKLEVGSSIRPLKTSVRTFGRN